MGDRRDTNDPRDAMRGMRKEARAELERSEQRDTGGQEHASGRDREGIPADERPIEAATRDQGATAGAPSDAEEPDPS